MGWNRRAELAESQVERLVTTIEKQQAEIDQLRSIIKAIEIALSEQLHYKQEHCN